jgi:hypothetical protein
VQPCGRSRVRNTSVTPQQFAICTLPSIRWIVLHVFPTSQSRESRGGAVSDTNREETHKAAFDMLTAFAGVGAASFDLTVTAEDGEKVSFRRAVPLCELRRILPDLLDRCSGQRWNVIVRPKSPPILLQLDDLDENARERLQFVSFLSLETSPGNYQSWIALPEITEPDFARRVRRAVGADPTASGATRIAGSLNFKSRYAPDYPRIAICHVNPGLLVSEGQLTKARFVSALDDRHAVSHRSSGVRRSPGKRWPSYERCVAGAPLNHEGTAYDISRADFTFCLIALDWGRGVEETAARLMDESAKARENGQKYAQLTAERAADAIARR